MFSVEQGVAQGCSLSPILFSVVINDLLKDVEQAELGIQLSGMLAIQGKACRSLCMETVISGD